MVENQAASMQKSQPCLILQDLEKWFGGLHATIGVSLTVNQGERLAIIGPNGAGKTTLFNLISGEFPPSSGKVILYGQDVTDIPNFKRVYLGLARTFQITQLFMELTVLENVILAVQGIDKVKYSLWKPLKSRQRLYDKSKVLLDKVELWDKRDEQVKNLSYGDQRLIELVLALASNPKILALDEPTAGLSIAESKIMVNALKKLDKSMTFLLIEHDMEVAFQIAERIMVLHEGKVVALDQTEKVRENPRVQEIYFGAGDEDESGS